MDSATRIEQAETELEAFIARRVDERKKANDRAEEWAASERSYHERRRRRNLEAWHSYYLTLAESHAQISADLAQRASRILDEEV